MVTKNFQSLFFALQKFDTGTTNDPANIHIEIELLPFWSVHSVVVKAKVMATDCQYPPRCEAHDGNDDIHAKEIWLIHDPWRKLSFGYAFCLIFANRIITGRISGKVKRVPAM